MGNPLLPTDTLGSWLPPKPQALLVLWTYLQHRLKIYEAKQKGIKL